MEHGSHAHHLPADLSAPPAVLRWRMRAFVAAAISAVLAVIDLVISHSFDYVLRGWLMGLMICLSFCTGGLALLMVQWCSGGKWGLLIRRPLEAMSRTLPLIFLMFLADRDLCQAPLHLGAHHRSSNPHCTPASSTPCRRMPSPTSGPI